MTAAKILRWIKFPLSTDRYFIGDAAGTTVASNCIERDEPIPRGWGHISYKRDCEKIWEDWTSLWEKHRMSELTLPAVANLLNQLREPNEE